MTDAMARHWLNAVALRAASVMPTEVGIHVFPLCGTKDVDGRAKPGHDGGEG